MKNLPRFHAAVLTASALTTLVLSSQAFAVTHPRRDITRDGLPNVQAPIVLAMNWRSGDIVFERNADEVRPIASLSKMFAALVIYQNCGLDPSGLHEMTEENRKAAKGSDHSKLTTHWKFTHRDLMYAALLRSDNRAIPALAEACGMDAQTIGARMTDQARAMNLVNTHFAEPTGLSPHNVSTAKEVMQILRQVMQTEELAKIMRTKSYVITAWRNGHSRKIEIHNTDRLLGNSEVPVMGGKTGYTDLARYCLAVALHMPKADDEMGVVVMGAEGKMTRFADVRRIVHWIATKSSVGAALQRSQI